MRFRTRSRPPWPSLILKWLKLFLRGDWLPRPKRARGPACPGQGSTEDVPGRTVAVDSVAAPPEPAAHPPPPEPAAEPTSPEAGLRAQLLRRFEAWLDEAMSQEPPPGGIDAEILAQLKGDEAAAPAGGPAGCDLYTLWSALTGLSGEIKLQGRAFKGLSDALGPVGALVEKTDVALAAHREVLAAHHEALAAHHEALDAAMAIAQDARAIRQDRDEGIRRTAHESAEREFLDLLLDLRDRLDRGLRSAQEQIAQAARLGGTGWLRRVFSQGRGRQVRRLAEAAQSLAKGCDLSLDRLNESLSRLGVSEIDCAGRPLDPELMRVVDVAEDSDVPKGTVLAVYRPGYQRDGQVVRLAEVKVARALPAGPVG